MKFEAVINNPGAVNQRRFTWKKALKARNKISVTTLSIIDHLGPRR